MKFVPPIVRTTYLRRGERCLLATFSAHQRPERGLEQGILEHRLGAALAKASRTAFEGLLLQRSYETRLIRCSYVNAFSAVVRMFRQKMVGKVLFDHDKCSRT